MSRDIVQFVPFRDFAQRSLGALSAEVLHELPGQVEKYFAMLGVKPPKPTPIVRLPSLELTTAASSQYQQQAASTTTRAASTASSNSEPLPSYENALAAAAATIVLDDASSDDEGAGAAAAVHRSESQYPDLFLFHNH
jgi:hypothetical protein